MSATNLVDVRDVWMIQRGRGFRFLNKAPHEIGICSEIRRGESSARLCDPALCLAPGTLLPVQASACGISHS